MNFDVSSLVNPQGQSIGDRLLAAKCTIKGKGLERSVIKATTEEPIAPKQKHLEDLLECSKELNVPIPSLAKYLIERTRHPNWVVVFKSLCTIHYLMNYGNERFIQYLASQSASTKLADFADRMQTEGSREASKYIHYYVAYLNDKLISYRLMAFDFCKVKRGREDGYLRTMDKEKVLIALPVLQRQIDSLKEFQVKPSELNGPILCYCFSLLFKDLVRLFACYNDGIINLLEKYFDMNKKQCKDAIDLYKKFIERMEHVAEFFDVARKAAQHVPGIDKTEIPEIVKAPDSLMESLVEHYNTLDDDKKHKKHAKMKVNFTEAAKAEASEEFVKGAASKQNGVAENQEDYDDAETSKKTKHSSYGAMDSIASAVAEKAAKSKMEKKQQDSVEKDKEKEAEKEQLPAAENAEEQNASSDQQIIDIFGDTFEQTSGTPAAQQGSDDLLNLDNFNAVPSSTNYNSSTQLDPFAPDDQTAAKKPDAKKDESTDWGVSLQNTNEAELAGFSTESEFPTFTPTTAASATESVKSSVQAGDESSRPKSPQPQSNMAVEPAALNLKVDVNDDSTSNKSGVSPGTTSSASAASGNTAASAKPAASQSSPTVVVDSPPTTPQPVAAKEEKPEIKRAPSPEPKAVKAQTETVIEENKPVEQTNKSDVKEADQTVPVSPQPAPAPAPAIDLLGMSNEATVTLGEKTESAGVQPHPPPPQPLLSPIQSTAPPSSASVNLKSPMSASTQPSLLDMSVGENIPSNNNADNTKGSNLDLLSGDLDDTNSMSAGAGAAVLPPGSVVWDPNVMGYSLPPQPTSAVPGAYPMVPQMAPYGVPMQVPGVTMAPPGVTVYPGLVPSTVGAPLPSGGQSPAPVVRPISTHNVESIAAMATQQPGIQAMTSQQAQYPMGGMIPSHQWASSPQTGNAAGYYPYPPPMGMPPGAVPGVAPAVPPGYMQSPYMIYTQPTVVSATVQQGGRSPSGMPSVATGGMHSPRPAQPGAIPGSPSHRSPKPTRATKQQPKTHDPFADLLNLK